MVRQINAWLLFALLLSGSVLKALGAPPVITDHSANSNAFAGAGFSYLLAPVSYAVRLPFLSVSQSSENTTAQSALKAVDGANATYSLTANQPGSFWRADLGRPFPVERIELVNRLAPADAEMAGLTLRLFNLDDQVVFQTNLVNPGSGGLRVIHLPAETMAREIWIGLLGTRTNGAGNYRVGLAEIRWYGTPDIPFGPAPVTATTNNVRVWQSSEYGGFPADNALDGNPDSFTHTADVVNSYWMADLGRVMPIDRVEIVNRSSCCDNRLSGLVLRLYDGASNSVNSALLSNPGLGATWTYAPPPGTAGRWIRVGLENGALNGGGNHYVTLAEARVFSGATNVLVSGSSSPVPITPNLASFKPSCMLRLDDTVPAAQNANDDRYATETKTTPRTVDGYWEVDLGATYALYGVRAIAAGSIGYRLTNTIVRLYDEAHESVYAQQITGTPDTFDVDLNGPRFARYVRIGLEDKTRTDPSGGIEFYIGFREVEVFGRPTNQVGILSFAVSTNQVSTGGKVTLSWAVDDVRRVEIHPAMGSVGAYTAANGIGTLPVIVTHSTEFLLLASNAAGIFSRAVSVQVASQPLPVRFSEIVGDNKYSLQDGYNEAPDWIELRNPGNEPADLTGWGLSDDPDLPMKWTFPATSLAPHGTLIVFASGRETPADPAGNLHANFRLEKNGGELLLTANNGVTTRERFSYPELDTDLAYGRDLDGHWVFLEPTPGAVNSAPTYLGWLKPLDWSHTRGFYDVGFNLTLTNKNPGATVLYSLDGSEPKRPYTNGLAITGTMSVRAQAVRPGYKSARIQTKTFVFVNDVITSPVMRTSITQDPAYAPRLRPGLLALPSLSICLPGQPEYEEKEGSLEVLWPKGGDPVQVNCGISRFGNAWTKYAKRSFRVKGRARYGEAKLNVPLFDGFDRGVLAKRSFDALDLRSGSQDMSERGFYMAGRFVEDSLLDMGSLNPHGRFVHVYINGVYWGQYDCRELLVEHFLADYLGGRAEDYVAVRGNDNVGDDFVLGTPDPPHLEAWETARALRNSYQAVREYVDVPHLIDFMLLWNYGNCESEYRACGPIEPGSGFKFWIADADGFLRASALGLNRTSRNGPGGLWGGLVAEGHSEFKVLLADRIYQHFFHGGALTPSANDARLAARMQEIRDSLIAECARWGYRTPANWESSAAAIRSTLFPARTAELVGYLRSAGLFPAFDPPAFNVYGGVVTNGFRPVLTSSSGTIYYTLDESDPRLPGGGISPTARVWAPGALAITNDLMLKVRVRSSNGQWSALAQPRFRVAARHPPAARDLLITEINYNPRGSDDCEFIELHNAGTHWLDLSGVSLSNAVRFVFPTGFTLAPGAFVLVVEEATAFAARYQTEGSPCYFPELTVAGEWIGALDNAGENIALVASNGVPLASVRYENGGDWPERADGQGSSLELAGLPAKEATEAEVQAFLAGGENWSSSSLYHGSPGRLDPFVKTVRMSEILTHTVAGGQWMELVNTGSQPVDLQDCSLTDNLDLPLQWTFPTNSTLLPGQFQVINSLDFAFKPLGGELFLLQLAGSNVIRFLDSVDFPAANLDTSFGLHLRSDGHFDFTEQRASTPGTANALPLIGPVVISEIMFAPGLGRSEFIELANLTSDPVLLYDPDRPTNVWRLEGVGGFDFPPGAVIAPCATLLLCATHAEVFRAQYELAASQPVLGPWPGILDPQGETLKLLRPGSPLADGTVPYYRVDHVSYRTNVPWPQILAGRSLERVPMEAYGNDPAYWQAGPLNGTPGMPATNRPPSLTLLDRPLISQRASLVLRVAVNDLDAPWQSVTLTPTQLPAGCEYDPVARTLSWTPSLIQSPGSYPVQLLVADGMGCASHSVTFQFSILVAPPLAAKAHISADEMQLSFWGLPGEAYRVEYGTDLVQTNWQMLQEILMPQNGMATVFDPGPTLGSIRFYRVLWMK